MAATTTNKESKQARFLAAYIECGANKMRAAKKANIPERTMFRWFREDQDFRERVSKAFEEFESDLLQVAMERAKGGSDVLIMFLLKAISPSRFCEAGRKQAFESKEAPDQMPIVVFGTYGEPGFEELPTIGEPKLIS